jgi:hypothetical protein
MLRRLLYRSTAPIAAAAFRPGVLAARKSRLIEFEVIFKPVEDLPSNTFTRSNNNAITEINDCASLPTSSEEIDSGAVAPSDLFDQTKATVSQAQCTVGTRYDLNLLIPDR